MEADKLCLLGVDGARLDIIQKWVREGELPFLAKVLKEGVSGNLRTVFPPHSMLAWTSLQTGKNPGKHGIYNTVLKEKESYSHFVPNADNLQGATMFDYLVEEHDCCCINLPVTYPPQNREMITVSSWLAPPFSDYVYPKDVSKEIKKLGYRIQPDVLYKNEEGFLDETYETTDKRSEVAEHLVEEYGIDFLTLITVGSEHLHHNYASFIDDEHPNHDPDDEEIVRDYYSFLDRKIEELVEKMGGETDLIIVSDHGFAPSYGIVYLNNVLSELGFFSRKSKKSFLDRLFDYLESSGLANRLRNLIDFDLLGSMPGFLREKVKEKRGQVIEADWDRTEAFCSGILGDIRINLKGREKKGVVDEEDYEEIREEIIKELKDSEVSEFIDEVHKKEDLFDGPCVEEMPDLFVRFRKQVVSSPDTSREKLYDPERRQEGFHTMYGVFMAYGPDFKEGIKLEEASIMDVAPTILHLLGEEIPEDMDGKVLEGIFRQGSDAGEREVEYREPVELGGEGKVKKVEKHEEVRQRLRELGYLD